MEHSSGFDAPKPEWNELWEGPLRHRATRADGIIGPGTSLSKMEEYGRLKKPFYAVRVDPDDGGAIVIEWLVGLSDKPPFQTVRYYNGGPGRWLAGRLKVDEAFRAATFANLPDSLHTKAMGAINIGITIREWMEREFYDSVAAGKCEIWARVGSKVAPFTRVPPDIFRAYRITSWGYGQPGGGLAEIEGERSLFSIYVAPPSNNHSATSSHAKMVATHNLNTGDPGRPTKGSQFYFAEHGKRCASGAAHLKLAPEARELHKWFKSTHPFEQLPTVKTIENRIRDAHNRYVALRQNPTK